MKNNGSKNTVALRAAAQVGAAWRDKSMQRTTTVGVDIGTQETA